MARFVRFRRLCASFALLLAAAPAVAQAPEVGATGPTALERADRSRAKGAADAPVTIIELSDFECPYCRQFAQTTLPRLDSAYVQTGKVRFLFINALFHPGSWSPHEAAMCAGAQDAFWPMHDRLFAEQPTWREAANRNALFSRYAADLGLDSRHFLDCLRDDLVAPLIVTETLTVGRSGAQGTPSFIIGERTLSGAQPYEEFVKIIEEELAK